MTVWVKSSEMTAWESESTYQFLCHLLCLLEVQRFPVLLEPTHVNAWVDDLSRFQKHATKIELWLTHCNYISLCLIHVAVVLVGNRKTMLDGRGKIWLLLGKFLPLHHEAFQRRDGTCENRHFLLRHDVLNWMGMLAVSIITSNDRISVRKFGIVPVFYPILGEPGLRPVHGDPQRWQNQDWN